YYQIWGGNISEKRAIIQGWGNVGSTAALYLAKYGVKIVGIIDREGGLMNPDGYSLDHIKRLFHDKAGNKLVADDLIPFEKMNKEIWSMGAEVFIPAAASRLVSKDQAESMINNELEVVSCGANVPFSDKEIFYGPIAEFVDKKVSLLPDFIANCGMARTFAFLMDPDNDDVLTDADIFNDCSKTIGDALQAVHKENNTRANLAETAFTISLNKLV
ncbi:MAG: amino acid dehydrogenase, partial [Ekhidna sp.]